MFDKLKEQCLLYNSRKVDETDDLLRCHVRQHLPHWLVLQPGAEVPQGVHYGRHRHGYHTLLWPQPPELSLVVHSVKPLSHVFKNILQTEIVIIFQWVSHYAYYLELLTQNQEPETVHTVTDDFVTPAQGEGQPMTTVASISGEANIDSGVVRVRVDRVRSVTLKRGGESGRRAIWSEYDIKNAPHLTSWTSNLMIVESIFFKISLFVEMDDSRVSSSFMALFKTFTLNIVTISHCCFSSYVYSLPQHVQFSCRAHDQHDFFPHLVISRLVCGCEVGSCQIKYVADFCQILTITIIMRGANFGDEHTSSSVHTKCFF